MPIDLVGRVHRTIVIDGCNPIDHERCAEMFAKRCGGVVEAWESVSVPKEDPKERIKRLRRTQNILEREERERKEAAAKAAAEAAALTDGGEQTSSSTVVEVTPTVAAAAAAVVVPEEKEEIEMVHRIFIVFVEPEVAQVAVGMTGMAFGGPRNILKVWVANEKTIDGRPRLTASNSHGHVLDKNDSKSGYYEEDQNNSNSRSDLLRIVGFKSMREENDAQPAGGGLLMIGGPSSSAPPPPRQKRVDTEEELEIIRKRKEILAALGGNMASFRPDVDGGGEDAKPENHTKSRVPNSMTSDEKEQFLSHHFVRQCGALSRLTQERVRALADEVAVWERRVFEAEKSYK